MLEKQKSFHLKQWRAPWRPPPPSQRSESHFFTQFFPSFQVFCCCCSVWSTCLMINVGKKPPGGQTVFVWLQLPKSTQNMNFYICDAAGAIYIMEQVAPFWIVGSCNFQVPSWCEIVLKKRRRRRTWQNWFRRQIQEALPLHWKSIWFDNFLVKGSRFQQQV